MIKGELVNRMEQLLRERRPFVIATIVRAMRPTSVRPGDSALVLADGTIEGFVGGVCAQASVRLHAARALETGEALILRLEPGAGEEAPEEGLVVDHNPCLSGGTMEIFLEPRRPALRMLVAGASPIARALTSVASAAGYEVERDEPDALMPSESDAAVIVASHGEGEEALLARALRAGVGYVALVASERRGAAVRDSLEIPDPLREQLHTPAGLEIGARTPEEVAIAILAEFVSKHVARPFARVEPVATAIDPVCGMTVTATESSIHADIGGQRLYFCSEGCRAAYIERNVTA